MRPVQSVTRRRSRTLPAGSCSARVTIVAMLMDETVGDGARHDVWIDDVAARASSLWDRGSRAVADVVSNYADRAVEDGEWSLETVTADLIDASDRLTPLLGEGLDLWLEVVQHALAGARPRGR
jgi:hypothetical protein